MSENNLGLTEIGDLSSLLEGSNSSTSPSEIDIYLISEDPNQPRNDFSEEKLNELAETIKIRGVKTPISVRPDPDNEGKYIINHGARRYRASIKAEKQTIPAYVDMDSNFVDQMIENIQRADLSPKEISKGIGRLLDEGMSKSAIAKALGKSNAFVTQHFNLISMPEVVANVFESEKCTDVTLVNELLKLYKTYPEEIADYVEKEEDFSRSGVKSFKDLLENGSTPNTNSNPDDESSDDEGSEGGIQNSSKEKKLNDPMIIKKPIIRMMYQKEEVTLVTTHRTEDEGKVNIKYDTGEVEEVSPALLKLVKIIEG